MKKQAMILVLLLLAGAGGAFLYLKVRSADSGTPEFCVRHEIVERDCPWCDPSLIETRGHCQEHDVPEALCAKCTPALVAGFQAEGDWCAGHAVPESQCGLCQAGDLPPGEERPD